MDDHGGGISVEKVKAHRSRASALAEGDATSPRHWRGNAEADAAAKEIAHEEWVHERARLNKRQLDEDALALLVARAAVCVKIAQRGLDSLGLPTFKKPRARRLRGGGCGEHVLEPRPASSDMWCVHCRLVANTTASRRTLAARPCLGDLFGAVPTSHRLRFSGGVTWCYKCAAYTSRIPRALRHECKGAPASAAARNVRRRLLSGLPPTTAPYLQRGRPAGTETFIIADGAAAARRQKSPLSRGSCATSSSTAAAPTSFEEPRRPDLHVHPGLLHHYRRGLADAGDALEASLPRSFDAGDALEASFPHSVDEGNALEDSLPRSTY